MKQPTFTENELSLIGECVLQTIHDLRSACYRIYVSDATQSIETTIQRCKHILDLLAEASHE